MMIVLAPTASAAPVAFQPHLQAELAVGVRAVRMADLNGDGAPDIIAASFGDDTLRWYDGSGSDSQSLPTHIISTQINGATDFEIADLDGDMDLDVVCIGELGDYLAWFENLGGVMPTWTEHILSIDPDAIPNSIMEGLLDGPKAVSIADVNGDGDLDIVASAINNDVVAVFYSDGMAPPGFTTQLVPSTSVQPTSVFAADINGDSLIDLVVSADTDDRVTWLENLGGVMPMFLEHPLLTNGAPEPGAQVWASGRPQAVFAADIDDDDDTDIVIGALLGDAVVLLRNQGGPAPSFAFVTLEASVASARAVRVVDVDEDGDNDVAAALSNSDEFAWYDNNGAANPGFVKRIVADGPAVLTDGAYDIDFGDFDGDGDRDVVTGCFNSDGVAWHEQQPVLNTTTGSAYATLAAAIDEALNGDEILAGAAQFTIEPMLDTRGKSITIRSQDDLEQPDVGYYTIDQSTTFRARNSQTLELAGRTDIDPGSAVTMGGRFVDVLGSAEVNLAGNSQFTLDATVIAMISGAWSFAPGASLVVTSNTIIAGVSQFAERLVDLAPFGSGPVASANIDDDGLVDLVSERTDTGTLVWYRQVPSPTSAMFSSPIEIAGFFGGLVDIVPMNVDADADTDLLIGTVFNSELFWLESSGGFRPDFTLHQIASTLQDIRDLESGDLDGDQDIDFVVASAQDDSITWFENVDGQFTAHNISMAAEGANAVSVGDIDGDGDLDLASSSEGDDEVAWYENDGGMPPQFTRRILTSAATFAQDVVIASLTADMLPDIASLSLLDGRLRLFRQLAGLPTTFVEVLLDDDATFGRRLIAVDMEPDGDVDLLTIHMEFDLGETIVLYENQGGNTGFVKRAVLSELLGFGDVSAVDIDGDDDLDVLYNSQGQLRFQEQLTTEGFRLGAVGSALAIEGSLAVDQIELEIGSGASLSAEAGITVTRTGTISGNGQLAADLNNAGRLAPSIGQIFQISGAYQQRFIDTDTGVSVTGAFEVSLAGEQQGTQYGAVIVDNAAALGGRLRAGLVDPYLPMIGDEFEILRAPTIIDRFDVALLPGFPDERFLRVEYRTLQATTAGSNGPGGDDSVVLVVDTLSDDVELDGEASFSAEGTPNAAAVGDLDGDGDIDLAVTIPGVSPGETGFVSVLYNAGTNSDGAWNGFASQQTIQVNVGVDPSDLAIGDVDGANGPDIIVVNRGDDTISILRNDGSGGFSSAVPADTFVVNDDPRGVAAIDLNGDGNVDVAVTGLSFPGVTTGSGGAGVLTVLLNMGEVAMDWGGFGAPQDFAALTDPTDVDPGDFDNDKDLDPDLTTANTSDGSVSVFINMGSSGKTWLGFDSRVDIPVDRQPVQVISNSMDLDLDGYSDIVSVNQLDGTVSVILSEGDAGGDGSWDGGFLPAVSLEVGDNARSVAAAPLDDDADLDLAVVVDDDNGQRTIRLLRNDLVDGQLAFAPTDDQNAVGSPLFVIAADVDSDEENDLITINESVGTTSAAQATRGPSSQSDVSVLLNVLPAACRADVSGNGVVDIVDLNLILGNFNLPSAAADTNNDGVVNILDLNFVLGNFRAECPIAPGAGL